MLDPAGAVADEDAAVDAEEGVADAHAGAAGLLRDALREHGRHVLALHVVEHGVGGGGVLEGDDDVRVGEVVARDALGVLERVAEVLALGVEDAVGRHAASRRGSGPRSVGRSRGCSLLVLVACPREGASCRVHYRAYARSRSSRACSAHGRGPPPERAVQGKGGA